MNTSPGWLLFALAFLMLGGFSSMLKSFPTYDLLDCFGLLAAFLLFQLWRNRRSRL